MDRKRRSSLERDEGRGRWRRDGERRRSRELGRRSSREGRRSRERVIDGIRNNPRRRSPDIDKNIAGRRRSRDAIRSRLDERRNAKETDIRGVREGDRRRPPPLPLPQQQQDFTNGRDNFRIGRDNFGTRRDDANRAVGDLHVETVDREKTCPMMVRVFCNFNKHNKLDDFNNNKFPEEEFHIYTWRDATLKEITELVKEFFPQSRVKGTYFDFNAIYPDFSKGAFSSKKLGTTCSGSSTLSENVTLCSRRFQVGDMLDISLTQRRNTAKMI